MLAGREGVEDEAEADQEDEKLEGGEDALDEGPDGLVAPLALLRRVERAMVRSGLRPVLHRALPKHFDPPNLAVTPRICQLEFTLRNPKLTHVRSEST